MAKPNKKTQIPVKKTKKLRKKRVIVALDKTKQLETEQRLAKVKQEHPEIFNLPATKRTIDNLTDYFVKAEEGLTKILPKEKRHYVIYLRKSTDDEAKQIRSIPDQLSECLELAKSLGVEQQIDAILEETESAKVSGERPIFDDMLTGFKVGRYHGLITWSPDRLSRNMKEAGEVIEMIDLEQIQDLCFKTYQFENNPNGKMLLGILFATSKQYSDKLAVDIARGITGNIKDGKYTGSSKRGYYADKSTGYFMPDGFNWELMREAVNMRLYHGKTNPEIAEYLNNAHLSIRKNQDEDYRLAKVTKTKVGEIFADPFYFGLYQYGKNLANLVDIYNFLPLITPDEYVLLNQKMAVNFGEKYAGRNTNVTRLDYGLLRGKVICDYCDVAMQFQHQEIKRGKNTGRWLISFYCRNKDCQRYKDEENKTNGIKLSKSIRAKYVMAHIEYTLRHCTKQSKEAYKMYIAKLELKLAQDKAIAKRKLADAQAELKVQERQYLKYQNFQIDHPADYKKHHKGKLEYYQNLINVATHNKTTSEQELKRLEISLPSEKQFYELINSYLLTLLNTNDLMEQDAVCNELVSNLRAGNDTVSVITLNKPYDLLVDMDKILTGGDTGTRTPDPLLAKQVL
jgi:DNA invertase Pin-like site-specific DNA recombinase